MAKRIDYLNEKGNAKVSVRNKAKKQSMEMLHELLKENYENTVVETERGTLAVQIAEDTNGDPIYFEIEGRVNQTDPSYKPQKKSKGKKEKKDEQEFNLFE